VAIAVGAALGFGLYFLLSRFVTSVTKGGLSPKTVLFGVSLFFFAPAALLAVAFLFPEKLCLAAIAMSTALIASAVMTFLVRTVRKPKGSD